MYSLYILITALLPPLLSVLPQTLWAPLSAWNGSLVAGGQSIGIDKQMHTREVLNLNVMFWLSFRLILQRIIRGYKSQKDKIH